MVIIMLSKTLIYYFHYNSKESTNGLAPIYCRITVNSTPKKFATGLYVQANNWDTVKQKAKGRNEEVHQGGLSLILEKYHLLILPRL